MSEQQYYITLKKELQRMNKLIDSKIVQGKSYSFESRKHAMIREMMNRGKQSNGWRRKSHGLFSFISSRA
jgi:hypothetical protein